MENYYYIEAIFGQELSDLSSLENEAMLEFSCTGIEEFSISEERVDEILGERSYSGADIPISVIEEVEFTVNGENKNAKKFYFETLEKALSFQTHLNTLKNIENQLVEKPIEDWNEKWRETYKPIKVSPDFEIIPSWNKEDYETQAQYKLFIYPGMGFGTGSHETTFLCMQLLLKTNYFHKNVKCLDFGCGSGILGLGLKVIQKQCEIDLYDIDIEALDNCTQNIELNELSNTGIRLLLPKDREKLSKKYEIVFANILKNVLELEIKYLAHSIEKDGFLILSGLLKEQEECIVRQYQGENSKLELVEVARKNDWIAILFKHL